MRLLCTDHHNQFMCKTLSWLKCYQQFHRSASGDRCVGSFYDCFCCKASCLRNQPLRSGLFVGHVSSSDWVCHIGTLTPCIEAVA